MKVLRYEGMKVLRYEGIKVLRYEGMKVLRYENFKDMNIQRNDKIAIGVDVVDKTVKGLVHIYYGNGKGKTTAAVGLGLRAYGQGKKVLMVQFLKDGNSGEIKSISRLSDGFEIIKGENLNKFVDDMTSKEKAEAAKAQKANFNLACSRITSSEYDLLILDEIIPAINYQMLDIAEVVNFIINRPPHLEIVLTGREPCEELISLADYMSEIMKIKHPYDKGIPWRIGIEK